MGHDRVIVSFDLQVKARETICMTTRSAPPLTGAERLRAVRLAHGWSLRDVCAPANIDPAHLSRVERGEKSLSIDALYRLAKVLGLPELAKQLEPYVSEKQLAPFISETGPRSSQHARRRERSIA